MFDNVMNVLWPSSLPTKPPTLTQTRTGVYCLSLSLVSTTAVPRDSKETVDVKCYCNHLFDGEKWDNFRYAVNAYGEELPLLTYDEYLERLDRISDNEEGVELQDAITKFHESHLTPLSFGHPAEQFLHVAQHLQKQFEAMLALEIFRLSVSSGWGDIPF